MVLRGPTPRTVSERNHVVGDTSRRVAQCFRHVTTYGHHGTRKPCRELVLPCLSQLPLTQHSAMRGLGKQQTSERNMLVVAASYGACTPCKAQHPDRVNWHSTTGPRFPFVRLLRLHRLKYSGLRSWISPATNLHQFRHQHLTSGLPNCQSRWSERRILRPGIPYSCYRSLPNGHFPGHEQHGGTD